MVMTAQRVQADTGPSRPVPLPLGAVDPRLGVGFITLLVTVFAAFLTFVQGLSVVLGASMLSEPAFGVALLASWGAVVAGIPATLFLQRPGRTGERARLVGLVGGGLAATSGAALLTEQSVVLGGTLVLLGVLTGWLVAGSRPS